ncbi:Aro80 protein [Martiniozyma asiatica (nom. inval.)]|nr:Aro80 protein [Martiniozyma asiatica]
MSDEPAKKKFKRNYLACLNCRTRKVKCDLGDVENPHPPPCVRCKRERKECVFIDSKRGTKKNSTVENISTSPLPPVLPKPTNSSFSTKPLHLSPQLAIPQGFSNIRGETLNESSNNFGGSEPPRYPVLTSGTSISTRSHAFPQKPPPSIMPTIQQSMSLDESNSGYEDSQSPLPEDQIQKSTPQSLPDNNATMVFLAHVAGKIARPDGRDRIDAKQRIARLEGSMRPPSRTASSQSVSRSGSEVFSLQQQQNKDQQKQQQFTPHQQEPHRQQERPKGTPIQNRHNSYDSEPMIDSFGHENSMFPVGKDHEGRYTVPPPKSTLLIRPRPGAKLTDIEYIGPSIKQRNLNGYMPLPIQVGYLLTEKEAERLISLFFATMHPFYPYIPKELQDPDILPGYPMLLCTLLAISARYHSLPDKIGEWDFLNDNSNQHTDPFEDSNWQHQTRQNKESQSLPSYEPGERQLAVHEQLWIYCQRLMSMTVWGESSSRSIGTLLSFLLFTEWNPRAIHFRWSDYANNADDDSLAASKRNNKPPMSNTTGGGVTGGVNGFGQPNLGFTGGDGDKNDEEYAGLSAMKRSEIMSFMLIGTAARLSFLLNDHPLIFISTHISETHTSIGLHKKSMLQQTLSEVDVNDKRFDFTHYQKATIELLQFISLCYETLYGTKPKFIMLDKYQTLAILDILSPILENWYRKYYKLLKPSNLHCAGLSSSKGENDANSQRGPIFDSNTPDWLYLLSVYPKLGKDLYTSIERESLILDYYYTKLYLYSLALSGDTSVSSNLKNSKKGRNLRLDELARYSRYVELAYKAGKEVLNVILRVRKLKLLKYMPVRWVTRVIKSVSFIVKCYLTLATDIKSSNWSNQNDTPMSNSESGTPGRSDSQTPKPISTNDEILKLSVIPVEEIITLLQKTAICLRDSTPDELHLCTRYSTILMYLCSQFKTQMKEHSKTEVVREYERDVEREEREASAAVSSTGDGLDRNTVGGGGDGEAGAGAGAGVSTNAMMHPVTNSGAGITGTGDGGMMSVGAAVGMDASSNMNGNNDEETTPYGYPTVDFNNANQELFDDIFTQNPSETLFNWFSTNDNNPGLDFVDQFTKEIEKDFLAKSGKQ